MADTLEQALLEAALIENLSAADQKSLVINPALRTIVMPENFFFGVYNDKDILKVPFVMPRYYNSVDLSEFDININYKNSAGYGNVYRVTEPEVTDTLIRFNWILGRGVFVKEGSVYFIVCLRQVNSGGEIERELNTTIARASVLKGLEVDENPDPIAYSILANMQILKEAAEAAATSAEDAAERIGDAATHAEEALAAMVGSPYIATQAADMLSHDKVYVYTGNETGYVYGNWYYYNGSEFVSGGIYNAIAFNTDDTLTQEGDAADAKAVGDALAELSARKVDGGTLDENGYLTLTGDGEDLAIFGPFIFGGTTEVVNILPQVGDPTVNYILKTADGLLFYKYVDNTFQPVGASAAIIANALPQVGNDLADYYIRSSNGIYYHYKYIQNEFKLIGGTTYTRAEVDLAIATAIRNLTNAIGTYVTDVTETSSGIEIAYSDESTKNVSTKDTRVLVEDEEALEGNAGVRIIYTDGSSKDIAIAGGGGGAGAGSASITRVTPVDAQCVYGQPFNIQYLFDAYDSSGDRVGSGNATWYVGGVRRGTSTARQNVTNTFDISPYLTAGENSIRVSVSVDTGGENPLVTTKTWTITAVNLYATWDYDDATINRNSTVTLRWTPYGDLEKTTHIKIDGTERTDLRTVTTRSGVQQTVTFERLAHGSHMVEMWLSAAVNENVITSDSIFHDMIFVTEGETTPIISCTFTQSTITQYNTAQIPFVVYDPAHSTSTVTLAENGTTVATLTDVPRTVQSWVYTPNTAGSKTLTITCGSVTKTITLTVESLDIDNEEVSGYTFRLKASDIASNSALRNWTSNETTATFSNNFDWNNGGLRTETDENGNLRQLIIVKAGTRLTINNKLFSDDPTTYGKTFKVIFKVLNCRDYDADVLQCYSGGIGVRMSAHEAIFSSTNTSVSVPYGENEYTELEFDIYPAPTQTNGSFRYIMAWIDGVITTCRVYGASDSFTQANADQRDIVIGSDDCDVAIYMIKAYPNYMTRENHIVNFIADAPNAQEMVRRYDRNDILDSSGEVDYQKLIDKNPDCRVWLYDIPYLTVGKKDKVKNCIFNQFWKNGDQYFELTGVGTMTVQGTSSVDYILGAANTDISFTALTDGYGNDLLENGVVDEDSYGKNFFVGEEGEVTVFDVDENTVLTSDCVPVERDANRNVTKYIKALGYKVNENSTPISYSNTKVNFASCEQVNNMCNALWYQRFQPYQSLTPRDCMEFSMGVQFIKDSGTVPDTDHFVLFGDNKYHLYSIANMGTSKKNVHLFHDLSNQNEVCIEVMNNLNDLCRMVADDMSTLDWSGKIEGMDHSFECRYPDTSDPSAAIKNGWQRFVTWMANNNPAAATGNNLNVPETYGNYTFRGHDRGGTQVLRGTTVTRYAGTYTTDTFNRRMAKMLSDCEDYLVMDSVVFHFCFLERHTAVDNVSKNTFWSSSDLLHWDLSKAYDMDTSDGNNNEGQLVFDYGNEADDVIGTKTVFNANDAVWFVFISNLYEACQTMFVNREAAGAWSATAYHNFLLSEQQKVPERVWVQCYWYDYLRTYESGINDSWMSFLDGGQKTHQRWHYEYYEEIYDSSKYRGTSCTVQNVNFRGYYPSKWSGITDEQWLALKPKAEIELKMYNKCYINVSIDGTVYQQKAERGQTYTIDFSAQSKLNDTVINIYSAQMIQEIGDLSRLYPGTPNFSNATRLRSLHVGSSTEGYRNSNLTSITFGNNTMLEYLYVQNLAYVTTNLILSNCQSLVYLDASGSSFTGYEFATGGMLETVYAESPSALIMRNLHYLTDENFHITSYDNLGTLVLEDCAGLDSLGIVNEADNLAIIRITGVDWIVADTGVLNRLLALQGRDEADHIIATSVLTGDVYVSGAIRNQEIERYETQWPDLAVTYDPNNVIASYLVQYVNADTAHTLLYETYVDRGDYPPDPYTSGLISIPTMPATAQYTYAFTGWDDISTVILTPRTVTAVYSSTIKSYLIRWFSRPGTPALYQIEKNYGTEAAYPYDTLGFPARNDEEGSFIVNSFAGWDKSTGYVTEALDVYAIWERAELPPAGKDLSEMTRAEINAVTTFRKAADYFEDKDHFDLRMGSDFDFSNVESETILENRFFDGTEYYDTDIKLFDENAPSFTLAIDYEFLNTNANNATLVSCFDEDGSEGFRLRYTPGTTSGQPNLQWGDRNVRAGLNDYRNLVVLRHEGGTRRLWVYTWNKTSTYDATITISELIRSRDTLSDNVLTFGSIRFAGDSTRDRYAKGWIYWSKVWHADLGDAACRKLASWPHQAMRMEMAGVDRYRLAGTTAVTANASFISNNLLIYLRRMNATDTNAGGWDASELRGFMNSRVYDALDYGWQCLIKKVKILASAGSQSTEILTSEDSLYLPAYQEMVASSLGTPYSEEGESISFFISNPVRAKFPLQFDFYISDDATYITESSDPTEMVSYSVKEGDVWINSAQSNNAYIYLPADKYSKHTRICSRPLTEISTLVSASDGGLWVRAVFWWERSPYASYVTNFMGVNTSGYAGYYNNATNTNGLPLCLSL